MSKSNCMQKLYEIILRGTKYRENMIFTDSSNLTNRSSNELETLHVSRFPSDLVHRNILTFYFLKK